MHLVILLEGFVVGDVRLAKGGRTLMLLALGAPREEWVSALLHQVKVSKVYKNKARPP